MSYYHFDCPHCGFKSVISDQAVVEKLPTIDLVCSQCEEVSEYDPKNLSENLLNDNQVVNNVDPQPENEDTDRLPTFKEMSISNDLDLYSLEPWQQDILEEFTEAKKGTGKPQYDYPMSINMIKSHQYGWLKFGAWAFNFKLKKQYRLHYKTWKEFCQKELHRSAAYVDKLIKATRVVKELICAGFKVLPKNEAQARWFTQFWGQELIDKWQVLIEAVPPHYITSTLIKEVFRVQEKETKTWVQVDAQILEDFETRAREKGFNPKEKLQEVLDSWEADQEEEMTDETTDDEVEEVPIEKLEVWQDDLQALIEEKDQFDNWFTKLIFWSLTNDRSPTIHGIP
ncbi:hypothetical protein [Crocosphaera sp.]|uniref:hypothetical protein n=1 Tax=Crocosphaera sp. TaxID=2729996 RepID=UPI0026127AEF|nr:hypothetical protein [Crocosphaera sp.]MDJ0582965.1 hypothetical protein [Crocosphaera sp.]